MIRLLRLFLLCSIFLATAAQAAPPVTLPPSPAAVHVDPLELARLHADVGELLLAQERLNAQVQQQLQPLQDRVRARSAKLHVKAILSAEERQRGEQGDIIDWDNSMVTHPAPSKLATAAPAPTPKDNKADAAVTPPPAVPARAQAERKHHKHAPSAADAKPAPGPESHAAAPAEPPPLARK